jgi:hypothetical protein
MDIIDSNNRIEKCSDHIQKIDDPAKLSDQRDKIPKGGELFGRDLSFSKINSHIAFDYQAYFVLYRANRIVFCFVDALEAKWLE